MQRLFPLKTKSKAMTELEKSRIELEALDKFPTIKGVPGLHWTRLDIIDENNRINKKKRTGYIAGATAEREIAEKEIEKLRYEIKMWEQMYDPEATEKKLKDYLPFYLGCACICNDGTSGKLVCVETLFEYPVRILNDGMIECKSIEDTQLVLRPFSGVSDLTEEEAREINSILNEFPLILIGAPIDKEIKIWARTTRYLLSRHFDLFGLIEAGLAVDKTK